MKDSQRFKLRFGKHKTPKFEYDDIVFDDAHGEIRIVGLKRRSHNDTKGCNYCEGTGPQLD
jgi:hypothetical protein